MSLPTVNWAERLLAVRTFLSDNTQINDPENYSKLTGTIDFLLNPALNPRTIEVIQQQNSNAGKYRSVEIRYQPHWGTEDLVTNDDSLICDKNNQRRDEIATYDVNLFTSYKFTLEMNYLRENNEDGVNVQRRLDDGFRRSMRVLRENMSSQLLAQMVLNIGTNPAQNAAAGTYTTVQMLNSAGGADVVNFDFIKNDQEENFMTGPIAIIGQGGLSNANKYFNRLATGNLNTDAGVDIREVANQFGMLHFKDQSTTANLGDANRVLAVYPGLTQFYGYNLYDNTEFIEVPGRTIYGTMPDPIYPINWDFKIEWDNNCSTGNGLQGAWVITVFKYFDLFTTPTAAFGGVYGDLSGFNGILGYEITSA